VSRRKELSLELVADGDVAIGKPSMAKGRLPKRRHLRVIKTKGNDPHQRTPYRNFSLVDRLAEAIDKCKASRALYHSPLWGWLAGPAPRLLFIHRWVEEQLGQRGYVRFSRRQVELWQFAFPRSRALDWSHHEMQWHLHEWEPTFEDLSLVAAMVLEARLSGALDVIARWASPLEWLLDDVLRQRWIEAHARTPAVKQFRQLILGLTVPSATPPRRVRSLVRNRWTIHNPPLRLSGDVAWLLAHEKRLRRLEMDWFNVGDAEAQALLDGMLAKRALYPELVPPRLIRTVQTAGARLGMSRTKSEDGS
jgi:hypothetical protein